MTDELLTANQVAQILKVGTKTVKRMKLPAVRIGDGKRPRYRYRQSDVEHYIKSHLEIGGEGVTSGNRKARREKRAAVSVPGLPKWEDAKRIMAGNGTGGARR